MDFNTIEMMEVFDTYETKCTKTVANIKNELLTIRAGRANPHILDKVVVDYYGTPTPLNQMGNITVSEARVLVISVWDANALKDVEKAIINANVGVTPNNDGKVIRLVFPELTQERRVQIVKDIRKMCEEAKVAIRNHRREANDSIKKYKKDSVITEDDATAYEKEVDKILSTKIDEIDKLLKDKEQEVMSV